MRKEELVSHYQNFCQIHHLDPRDVVVGAGGTLTLLGLRQETSDIDTMVPWEVMFRFLKAGHAYHYFGTTLVVEGDSLIDMHGKDREVDTICVDGVWCESAQATLDFKRRLNRDKDQADIRELVKYLAR